MKSTLIAAACACALLFSCDYVDKPFAPGSDNTPPVQGTPRKILLEEFTGHKCPTCPAAHVIAQQLLNIYGDRLIIVSEHVTVLADPAAAPYTTNFHTPAGDAYFAKWPSDAIPRGMVSRVPYQTNVSITKDNWSAAIAALIGQQSDVKLWFAAFTYDSGTHTVNTTVKCVALSTISGSRNLAVQLLEDHVIDYQYDGFSTPPDIPNYDHRHVLRDNLNGTWGEPLIAGSAAIGDTITKTFSYTLPANVVNPDNCSLVAYVRQQAVPATTVADSIYQVEERKFIP